MSEVISPLTIAFSPCPNDTFIFDALVHQKIDTEGLEFKIIMDDVEALNRLALSGSVDICKVSYAAFLEMTGFYQLLQSGGALGRGVGPLLITTEDKRRQYQEASDLAKWKVVIPGRHTTAGYLFSVFFPEAKDISELIFSNIEDAILSGEADAGVIIHENRFTYESKGLKMLADLGAMWEEKTGAAIPLGGIVIRKSFTDELKEKVNRIIRRSVEYAMNHPQSSYEFVKMHAQEMDESVRRKHIELYVNDYSINLGNDGIDAVFVFFEEAVRNGRIPSVPIGFLAGSSLSVS